MSAPSDYPDTMHQTLAAVLHAIPSLLRPRVERSIENAALRPNRATLVPRMGFDEAQASLA